MISLIKLLLPLYFLLNFQSAYSNFGDSCELYPITADYAALEDKNVYGYVQSQIDMTTYVPSSSGCSILDGKITICLATPGLISQTPPCELITFSSGDKKKLYDSSVVTSQSNNHLLKNVEFYANVLNDSLCVFMPTSQGDLPVACKKKGAATAVTDTEKQYSCKVSKSCYDPSANYSKSLFNFSGKAVHCVKETFDKVLNPEEQCLDENNTVFFNLNPFSYFQDSLKNAVRGALIIYIIFFGINLALEPSKLEASQVFTVILKVILVLYFSVGIGKIFYFEGGSRANDGITQFVLPILLQIINDFPSMIFDASETANICQFSPGEYPEGYGFYHLWDSIDCRVSYYLGGESFKQQGSGVVGLASSADKPFYESYSFAALPLTFLMMLGGQFVLLIFTAIFITILLSLLLFFISSYLVCLTCIYAMCYIAPIFIPMVLFEKTKGYFDSWLRITLSFALQPMVIASFIVILTVFYDQAVFGECEFELEEIDGVKHYHFVNITDECKTTFGYKLYDVVVNRKNIDTQNVMLFVVTFYKEAYSTGYLVINTIFLSFLSIIFFYFSKLVSQFASDLTGGALINSIVVDPTLLMNKAKSSVMKVAKKISKSTKEGSDTTAGGADPMSSSQNEKPQEGASPTSPTEESSRGASSNESPPNNPPPEK